MINKLVIFDVDGTILDTRTGILESIKETIEYFNLPVLAREEMLTFIGPPVEMSFFKYYNLNTEDLRTVAAQFREIYCQNNLFKASLYEGTNQVFEYLKNRGIPSAIATYKRESYLLPLLKFFKIDQYTNNIFGSDPENKLKKVDIIRKCISQAKMTELQNVYMVGDTKHDAEGADELGIPFIAVTYGFGFHKKDNFSDIKACHVVHRPVELVDYFNDIKL